MLRTWYQSELFMFPRTCAREKGHLVLQIGTSCGDRAALVAKKMEQG
jgi:hypothetical protein